MTIRAADELIDRVRREAGAAEKSVNEYVVRVLDAATDPDLAGDDVTRLRERLQRAGLLAPRGEPRQRPDAGAVACAREAAGRGPSAAAGVIQDRG